MPSVTETLVAWGLTPAACTEFCEQPGLPHVGGTKTPDLAAIVALAPDLVVMDEEENTREAYDALVAAGLDVLALAVRGVADVGPALDRLARRLGRPPPPEPGPASAPTPGGGRDAPGARLAPPGPDPDAPAAGGLRAFVPIWPRPWMALGTPTYGASLLARLGVDLVPAGAGPYPEVELGRIASLGPDVVLAPTEPYRFRPRHLAALAAVGPVVEVDGQDLFWWGDRTARAVARLGAVVAGLSRVDRR